MPSSEVGPEASTELAKEVASDEFLERFIAKNHQTNGALKWQALRLRKLDQGGMSVARLIVGFDACVAAGQSILTNGLFGFAETTAGAMRVIGHGVTATDGPFEGHAEIRLTGVDPEWPIAGPLEPAIASPEKLAEWQFYEALLPYFRFRPIEERASAA